MNFEPRRTLRAALAAVATAMLASCGGGSLIDDFSPRRVVAFGDEATAMESDGRKYSINAVESEDEDEPVCSVYPNWAQYVAEWYSLEFDECAAADGSATPSINEAQAGARIADVEAQVDAFIDGGGNFSDSDLVLVMAGANDVIDQFEAYEAGDATESAVIAELRERAEQLAEVVNRIARDDGRVLIATVPHLHRSPYARAKTDAQQDVIERMVNEFNSRLRTEILNDGHLIGIVRTDIEVARILDSPSSRNVTNTREAACLDPLPNCTANRLVADANVRYMWADDLRFGPQVQRRFGELAVRRARNNPF
jgi:phospholipase/lecithinase/hemolysin